MAGRSIAGARALRTLAELAGILPEYVDQQGRPHHTRDDTRVALLAAMGIDASGATAARQALESWTARDAARLLPPARAVAAGARELRIALPHALGPTAEWTLALRNEHGATHRATGRARRHADGTITLPLPIALAVGYHRFAVAVRARGLERRGTQMLIAAPPTCPSPSDVLRGERAVGITANLYSVRSGSNWGAGNFGDLARLVAFAAEAGAAFVGVNPLHALRNRGNDISPYSPISRLFRNQLYLDVQAIPELADTPDAREHVASPRFQRELARLRAARTLDYDAVTALQRPVLDALHRTFVAEGAAGASRRRHAAYARYVAAQGRALEDFATFRALEEHLARGGTADWHAWPEPYRDPRSDAVAAFRARHATRVDFHRWVQFELDRQLGAVAARARTLGLPIGVYQDLAIGTSPAGSDAWAFPDLFAHGASIGAPPDPLAPDGQDWGLPPLDPHRLADRHFDYWIALLRAALRDAGALRIDHVMGLFRQFWIPAGMSGRDGAYVRFPSAELLAILAVESTRAGAIVVGEDLGTVPPEVPPTMERWGVLGSRVLYFERDAHGDFRPAGDYPRMALATATTHDLATIAGFWAGRDIALRAELGLTRDRTGRADRDDRERDRAALLRRLRSDALLPPATASSGAPDDLAVRAATHAFLRRTPSWLVGLALDDLVGESEPVNLPGVGPEQFSSWTRRLTTPLEALRDDPAVQRALGVERRWIAGAAGMYGNDATAGAEHGD